MLHHAKPRLNLPAQSGEATNLNPQVGYQILAVIGATLKSPRPDRLSTTSDQASYSERSASTAFTLAARAAGTAAAITAAARITAADATNASAPG